MRNKYYKQELFISHDGGETWTSVGAFQKGALIEVGGDDCSPQMRMNSGTPYCVGYDKYYDKIIEVSYDKGETWEFYSSAATLVEINSTDCGYAPIIPLHRDTISGSPFCFDGDKMAKVINQVSYDNGETWEDTGWSIVLIEKDSPDCRYVPPTPDTQYRWTNSGTTCYGYDKYVLQVYEVSYDSGATWSIVTPLQTRIGALVESDSTDCGYVPPIPSGTKYLGTYSYGATYSAECDSDTTLTSATTKPSGYSDRLLVSAYVGNCVTSIGDNAFVGCFALSSVTIPNSVTSIGDNAFAACSGLTSIVIPNSVTSIGTNAFALCSGLTSIEIPNSVTSIGNNAFNSCSGATSLTIGSGVTSIGDNAFRECLSITSVTIPSSVTSIGSFAFSGCSSLTSITINATTPPTFGNSLVFDNTGDCPIYVPCESLHLYKNTPQLQYVVDRIVGISPCNPLYRTTSGTPYCDGYDKWVYINSQVSYDGGSTWETTAATPTLVEAHSSDCGYTPQYRVVSGTPYCNGYNKWIDVYSQVSYDGGQTWDTTTTTSTMIERNSTDCGYEPEAQYRWTNSGTTCSGSSGYDKYNLQVYEVSYDSGATWSAVTPTQTQLGTLIEADSIECGFPVRFTAAYYDGTSYIAKCNSSSTLTSGDTRPYGKSILNMKSAVIGDCITSIGDGAFFETINGLPSLTSVTIPDTITSFGANAFNGCGGLTSITIPNGVTSIGHHAFCACRNLTGGITIPSGITSIEYYTFFDCQSLSSITIPSGVTSIGNAAFWGCRSLTSIDIPSGITSISDYTFKDCSSLTSIDIPSGVTSIGTNAFGSCSGLTSIEIPNSITSIGQSAFDGCSSLTSVTIGSGVTSIGNYAFQNCSGLTSIDIPNSVTSIGEWAFYNCSGITDVIIGSGVIGSSAFQDCTSLSSVTIGSGVTVISGQAFEYCSGLTSIEIPNSVTNIGALAFYGCSGLTSITINASTPATIDDSSFYGSNCPIYVPCASVDAYKAASGWSAYESRIEGISPCNHQYRWADSGTTCSGASGYDKYNLQVYEVSYDNGSTWSAVTPTQTRIGAVIEYNSVDCGYLAKFTATYNDSTTYSKKCDSNSTLSNYDLAPSSHPISSMTSIEINDCITSIGDFAFYASNGLTALTSVTMLDTITSIGNYAFHKCSGLTSIDIPNSVTSIGNQAFQDCANLSSITIGSGLTSIGGSAFKGCTSLSSIDIPNGVTSIGNQTFQGCTSLSSIDIPNSVTSIGDTAFQNCASLSSITIGSGVTTIGTNVFKGCTNLPVENSIRYADTYAVEAVDKTQSAYTLKNSTKWIGANAFSGCTSLTSITIPNSVINIGAQAFRSCTNLSSVTIPTNVTSIGDDSFNGCSSLTSCTIGSGVTSIGNGTFSQCSSLTSIEIPSGVTSIGNYAFRECSSITSITIPNSVTSIGNGTFNQCTSLANVTIPSGVTKIGYMIFYYCTSLQSVTINAVTPPTLGSSSFDYTNDCPIYVPAASVDAYKAASGWSTYASRIQAIP